MNTVPPGVVCSFQDYERSLKNHSISCLTRADSIGLTVTTEAGVLSLLAILYVFLVIGRNVLWRVQHMSAARLRIFHQPMDILMFTLFLADAVQAVGMVMSAKWVHDGRVEVGTFCTTQGLIKMIGATTVALSTFLIALYTFVGLWMMKGISSMKNTVVLVVGIVASTVTLAVIALATHIDPSKPNFMGPTPYWCWVNSHYMEWRVLGEYLWMWITLFFSLFVYVPLFFWMRGSITFKEYTWWKFSFSTPREPFLHISARRRRSLVMLVYPGIYCLCIMPLSIVRWIAFVQESKHDGVSHMPSAATLASEAIFGLSGFFNVILLIITKPGSGLFGQLMFVSPAQPPSDPYRDERSTENDYGLGKLEDTSVERAVN